MTSKSTEIQCTESPPSYSWIWSKVCQMW